MDVPSLLVLGVLDGFNVCSLSLLTLFLSLLYTANAPRRTILLLGGIYILSVFASYFLTGLGILLLAVNIPVVPHFLSRIAAAIMIFIGLANILNYVRPGLINLNFAPAVGRRAVTYLQGGGVASTAVAGLLVGVHNFPCACTGGIYPMVIALIAEVPLRIPYLLVYNLMFVLPLTAILYTCSSKTVTVKVRRWQQANRGKTLFVVGLVMVTAGFLILLAIALGAA